MSTKKQRSRQPKSEVVPPLTAPIPLNNRSNGEYFHAQTPREKALEQAIFRRVSEAARKLGMDRRAFMQSSMGMATALSVVNLSCSEDVQEHFASQSSDTVMTDSSPQDSGLPQDTGKNGFDVGTDVLDQAETQNQLCGDPLDSSQDFIFDVQTHHINPNGAWRQTNPLFASFFSQLPYASCGDQPLECFSSKHYIEQIFLNSQTSVAVLSTVPAALCTSELTANCGMPLDNNEIVETRELVNALAQSQRVLNHCMVLPNLDPKSQFAIMDQVQAESTVSAWKCYPPWGPKGVGWRMDDPKVGIPFIAKGVELGVPIFCIHKGLPLPSFDGVHSHPEDVVLVSKTFPEASFIVYHSAFRQGSWTKPEGPYDAQEDFGVNTLIKSLIDNNIEPGSNVYAELGSVWGNLMTSPNEAAHVLGKLLKYVGEDNVLWGTDCIWTGSPQPQIEAFRTFTISEKFQDMYGYPALTKEIKQKILGLNAAKIYGIDPNEKRCHISKDELTQARLYLDHEFGARRWISLPGAGPKTRREFLDFLRFNQGMPG